MAQITVHVQDPRGQPLSNCKVSIYRMLPYSHVKTDYTDDEGKASFDGLWPYTYILAGEHETKNLDTPPKIFNVGWQTRHEFNLTATPPPHTYEQRIQLGVFAKIGEWLADHFFDLASEISRYGGKLEDAWVEGDWLIIRYTVNSPFPWLIIGAIIGILALLVVLGWEIKEVVPQIPKGTWWLLGLAAATAGTGAVVYALKK